jgi:hypothetical protein
MPNTLHDLRHSHRLDTDRAWLQPHRDPAAARPSQPDTTLKIYVHQWAYLTSQWIVSAEAPWGSAKTQH